MSDSVTTIPKRYVVASTQQPTGAFDGQIWYDTGTGQTKQYKNGSWETITANTDPIKENVLKVIARQVDLAYQIDATAANFDDVISEAFTDQTGVASTSGDLTVSDGADGNASLINVSSTVNLGAPTSSYDRSDAVGIEINPNSTVYGVKARIGSAANFTEVGIADSSGNRLASKTGSFSNGQTVEFDVTLDSSTNYYIFVYDDGASYAVERDGDANLPATSTDLDVTGGAYGVLGSPGASSGYSYVFDQVEAKTAGSSGSVTLTRRSLGFTPVSALPTQNGDIPSNTDLTLTISDNSGNSVQWSASELGDEKSLPFSDGDIQITIDQTNNGGGSPTSQDIGVMFGA